MAGSGGGGGADFFPAAPGFLPSCLAAFDAAACGEGNGGEDEQSGGTERELCLECTKMPETERGGLMYGAPSVANRGPMGVHEHRGAHNARRLGPIPETCETHLEASCCSLLEQTLRSRILLHPGLPDAHDGEQNARQAARGARVVPPVARFALFHLCRGKHGAGAQCGATQTRCAPCRGERPRLERREEKAAHGNGWWCV